MCKGPEAGIGLLWWENSENASVTGAQGYEGRCDKRYDQSGVYV